MKVKMPISKVVQLLEDCSDLFLDYSYDEILSDGDIVAKNHQDYKMFVIKTLDSINQWGNGLKKITTTSELIDYYQSATHEVQLGVFLQLELMIIRPLKRKNQDIIIEFPLELPLVVKEVFDSSFGEVL